MAKIGRPTFVIVILSSAGGGDSGEGDSLPPHDIHPYFRRKPAFPSPRHSLFLSDPACDVVCALDCPPPPPLPLSLRLPDRLSQVSLSAEIQSSRGSQRVYGLPLPPLRSRGIRRAGGRVAVTGDGHGPTSPQEEGVTQGRPQGHRRLLRPQPPTGDGPPTTGRGRQGILRWNGRFGHPLLCAVHFLSGPSEPPKGRERSLEGYALGDVECDKSPKAEKVVLQTTTGHANADADSYSALPISHDNHLEARVLHQA